MAMLKLPSVAKNKFFPAQLESITCPSVQSFARRYRRDPVYVPTLDRSVQTAYIGPMKKMPEELPVCFLHGFESSSFDFRHLMPYVEHRAETWAVDLVGWGFTDHSSFIEDPSLPLGPAVKSEHLYEFWKMFIRRPMCLTGVSLGGAAAIDYLLRYPETVDCLVLSSPQGYVDGLGMLSKLPTFIARLGVRLLQIGIVRRYANEESYYDKSLDLEEATLVNMLHTLQPGWTEASLAFIRSDGYSVSKRIPEIDVPTLILWGKEDKILGTGTATRFLADIENCELHWIENCGHAVCLERHEELGDHLISFLEKRRQHQPFKL